MQILIKRVSLIIFFTCLVCFLGFMKSHYIVTSSLFLVSGILIYNGGDTEKIYIENIIIIVLGLGLIVFALLLKEVALTYTGTTY